MAVVEKERLSWRPSDWLRDPAMLRDGAAWLVSLVVHMSVFLVLAYLTLLIPIRERVTLSAMPLEQFDEELVPQEFHFAPEVHEQVGMLSEGGLEAARPTAPVQADRSEMAYELEPTTSVGEIEVHEFDRTILEGPNIPENVIVKGAGSVGTSGRDRSGRSHHARNPAVARRAADARRVAVRPIGQPQAAARIDRQAVRPRLQGAGHHRSSRATRRSSSTAKSRC